MVGENYFSKGDVCNADDTGLIRNNFLVNLVHYEDKPLHLGSKTRKNGCTVMINANASEMHVVSLLVMEKS